MDDPLVDLAADISDLARPIAAKVFMPADWADRFRRSTEGGAATRVADLPGYPEPV